MAEEHLDLDGLRAELNRYPDGTPMEVLNGLLQRVQVSCEDVASSISFGDEEYERNPICSGPGWELVCICWRPGQTSPVHDHRGSGCGILVLRGTLTETVFETTSDGPMAKTGSRDLHQGEICASHDDDIHRIENAGEENLVTLHVYTPPLRDVRLFDAATGAVRPLTYDDVTGRPIYSVTG